MVCTAAIIVALQYAYQHEDMRSWVDSFVDGLGVEPRLLGLRFHEGTSFKDMWQRVKCVRLPACRRNCVHALVFALSRILFGNLAVFGVAFLGYNALRKARARRGIAIEREPTPWPLKVFCDARSRGS